jgi:hypothetical protein
MSLKKHTQQLPGWRQYSDALVGWFRDGVADLKSLGIRLEAGRTRRVSLSKQGGNLVIVPEATIQAWHQGGCTTVTKHLLSQPVRAAFFGRSCARFWRRVASVGRQPDSGDRLESERKVR